MIKLKDLLEEAKAPRIDPNWRDRKWGKGRMGTNEGPQDTRKKRLLGRVRQSILQALKMYTDSPTRGARINVEARMDEFERAFGDQHSEL